MHEHTDILRDHPGILQKRRATRALSVADGIDLRKTALRQLLAALLVLGVIVLMWDKIAQLDLNTIRAALKSVAPWRWLAASGFTAVSFWALGRYDRVVHRLLRTSADMKQAEQAGIAAIAISQTVGMGVISASFLRWRMLPDASLTQAVRLTAIVSASFLVA